MKSGFKVLDSDLHTMEPDGLWERYLDEPFKKFAPRFVRREDNASNQPVIKVGDLDIAEFSKRPSHLARRQEPPGTGLRAPPALRGGARARLRRRDASAGDGHRGHRRRRHLRHARPAGADARRPRSPGRGGARPRPQQLDARFLRAGPRPAQVRRAARVSRRALGRRRGAARRARAGRGGGDRQSQPDQWPPRPRPPLRPAVGRGGGAGRARRLSSHRASRRSRTTSRGATSTRPMAG